MEKQKILFLINSYGSKSETFIADQISYYREKSEVFIWSKSGDFPQKQNGISFRFPNFSKRILFSFINIKFIRLQDGYHFMKRIGNLKYYSNFELLYYLIFIRKYKVDSCFDIVYAHFGMNGKLAEELQYFNILKTQKLYTHFHGLDLLSSIYSKHYYHQLFRNASGIICGTKYALTQLNLLGNKNRNTEIIPCGANDEIFSNKPDNIQKSSSKIQIISVGRFIKFKGMIRFIDLAKTLVRNGLNEFHIELIGNGPEFENVEQLIFENKLEEYINLTGALPHQEVSDKIASSDVFVYLGITDDNGREETQGVVILEAQYCKLPVITTKVGGVYEYILENETGFVFDKEDIQGIALKIIALSNDKEKMNKIGENAHQFVKANLTQSILLEKNFNHISN